MTEVSQIMEKDVITGSPDENLSKIISKMEGHDIKEVPIVKNKKIKGVVTYYDILDIYAPRNVKASSVMTRPSSIEHNSSIQEGIRRMALSGLESISVVKGGKLVGIVSEYDILKYLLKKGELKKYRLRDFLIEVPSLKQDDPLSKARAIMRKNKVSRLPVVNKEGKSIGLLLLMDILAKGYKRVSKRERKPYNTSYKSFLEDPVENLMREVPKLRDNEKLEDVVKLLLKEELKGISILNEKNEPVGIFSRVHLFNKIAERYKEKGLKVTISGKEFEWEIENSIKQMIRNYGRKLKYFTKINHLKIHIKGVHKAEGKQKFEVELRVLTPGFGIEANETGFDVLYTLKRGLEKLERRLRDEFYERVPHEKK